MNAKNNECTAKTVTGLFGRYKLNPLVDWWERQRAIDELLSLDDHTLKDILRRIMLPSSQGRRQQDRARSAANDNLEQRSRAMGQD